MNTRSFALAASLAALATSAHAAEITLSGTTAGSFDGAAFATPTTLGGLTFTGGAFTSTGVAGFIPIGNSGPGVVGDLGTFSLSNLPFAYGNGPLPGTDHTFSLQVTFTSPTGITPSNTAVFSTSLFGTVSAAGNGGVYIDFDNSYQTFTFDDGVNQGSFLFGVNDLTLLAGGAQGAISGQAFGTSTASAVPGPTALAAFGFGVLANVRRRRRA